MSQRPAVLIMQRHLAPLTAFLESAYDVYRFWEGPPVEAAGDIRALVVGGKVVATMKRTGAADDFRSNLHRGGSAELIKITPAERSTAVSAAKRMGLNVCGVDMLRSNHGPVIMEVNSSPGLEGIENATGKDIAGQIIDYIAANAKVGKTKTKGKG